VVFYNNPQTQEIYETLQFLMQFLILDISVVEKNVDTWNDIVAMEVVLFVGFLQLA